MSMSNTRILIYSCIWYLEVLNLVQLYLQVHVLFRFTLKNYYEKLDCTAVESVHVVLKSTTDPADLLASTKFSILLSST